MAGKWECEWWRLNQLDTSTIEHVREKFPYRRSLAVYWHLGKWKVESCLIIFNATQTFSTAWSCIWQSCVLFSKTIQSVATLLECWREGKQKKVVDVSSSKTLNSSFKFPNERFIGPLLLFFEPHLARMLLHRFVECTLENCFINFEQTIGDATRPGAKIQFAEYSRWDKEAKLLTMAFDNFQIMDCRRHGNKVPERGEISLRYIRQEFQKTKSCGSPIVRNRPCKFRR